MERFFSDLNSIDVLSDNERNKLFDYRDTIAAFSRTIYCSLYIIDYEKKTFDYVSENPLFLCGHAAEEVKEMGYAFFFKHVIDDDIALLLKINKIGFDFFDKIPIDDRKLYTISYDFHIKTIENRTILVNQKLTPLFLTESGKIWKALCNVSLSTQQNAGNIQISKKGANHFFEYDLAEEKWRSKEIIKLSDRELAVLELTIRGFTMNEIADNFCFGRHSEVSSAEAL